MSYDTAKVERLIDAARVLSMEAKDTDGNKSLGDAIKFVDAALSALSPGEGKVEIPVDGTVWRYKGRDCFRISKGRLEANLVGETWGISTATVAQLRADSDYTEHPPAPPTPTPPREPTESVAERIVTDKAFYHEFSPYPNMTWIERAIISALTADRAAADAEIERLTQENEKQRADLVTHYQGAIDKHYKPRIAELEKLVSDLRESLGTAHRRARECESKLAALESANGEGVKPNTFIVVCRDVMDSNPSGQGVTRTELRTIEVVGEFDPETRSADQYKQYGEWRIPASLAALREVKP